MVVICPECDGEKGRVYSCCTGEHTDNDHMMCPVCREHLGEEDCYTCKGYGWVTIQDAIFWGFPRTFS